MSNPTPVPTGIHPTLTFKGRFLRLARELEALAGSLDTSAEECECCGANRFKAYDEELAARKLVGWADSLQNLANATSRKTGEAPAYLARMAPLGAAPLAPTEPGEPGPDKADRDRVDRVGLKWDALWKRLVEGDDMHAVARDVQGLIENAEHVHASAGRVLTRINPWVKANVRGGERL